MTFRVRCSDCAEVHRADQDHVCAKVTAPKQVVAEPDEVPVCPTCERPLRPLTPAERQRRYRERRNAERNASI